MADWLDQSEKQGIEARTIFNIQTGWLVARSLAQSVSRRNRAVAHLTYFSSN